MVVGHSHKYIYFAVPRTASLSLCRFFIDDYGGHMTNLTKRAKSLVEDFEGETFESLYA